MSFSSRCCRNPRHDPSLHLAWFLPTRCLHPSARGLRLARFAHLVGWSVDPSSYLALQDLPNPARGGWRRSTRRGASVTSTWSPSPRAVQFLVDIADRPTPLTASFFCFSSGRARFSLLPPNYDHHQYSTGHCVSLHSSCFVRPNKRSDTPIIAGTSTKGSPGDAPHAILNGQTGEWPPAPRCSPPLPQRRPGRGRLLGVVLNPLYQSGCSTRPRTRPSAGRTVSTFAVDYQRTTRVPWGCCRGAFGRPLPGATS